MVPFGRLPIEPSFVGFQIRSLPSRGRPRKPPCRAVVGLAPIGAVRIRQVRAVVFLFLRATKRLISHLQWRSGDFWGKIRCAHDGRLLFTTKTETKIP
jgi:hypothetical protein